jgi:hypothetical protein
LVWEFVKTGSVYVSEGEKWGVDVVRDEEFGEWVLVLAMELGGEDMRNEKLKQLL